MNPLILIIMDGFGIKRGKRGNAVNSANLPNYNRYLKSFPNTTLKAAQESVGLPKRVIGNSEVGHLNMGSGRIVFQELTRINKSIKDKSFFKNKVLLSAINNSKKKNKNLHLIGLLSDGGVHSSIGHLFALLNLCKLNKMENVYLHLFLDGRDVPPKSALSYLRKLTKIIKKLKTGKISTIIGRYYAMDRDKRWHRTERAYNLLVKTKGKQYFDSINAIKEHYKKGITDEFMEPIVFDDFKGIKKGDSVIFFNFRSDRARQISSAFVSKNFKFFKRNKVKVTFVSMCEYDKKIKTPIAFLPLKIKNTLGEVLTKSKLRQLRIAETEKYAHVTFFFNGGIEKPNKNEDRITIPSPKVATYDLKPEMSAYMVKDEIIKQIRKDKYNLILLNFANPDMVGHTGKLNKAITAVETVDKCIKSVVDEVIKKQGIALITSDHGNCEEMKGKYSTSHTLNDVPFILIGKDVKLRKGVLADIAPTVLQLLGIKKPKEMTGKSLIV